MSLSSTSRGRDGDEAAVMLASALRRETRSVALYHLDADTLGSFTGGDYAKIEAIYGALRARRGRGILGSPRAVPAPSSERPHSPEAISWRASHGPRRTIRSSCRSWRLRPTCPISTTHGTRSGRAELDSYTRDWSAFLQLGTSQPEQSILYARCSPTRIPAGFFRQKVLPRVPPWSPPVPPTCNATSR